MMGLAAVTGQYQDSKKRLQLYCEVDVPEYKANQMPRMRPREIPQNQARNCPNCGRNQYQISQAKKMKTSEGLPREGQAACTTTRLVL